MSFIKSRNQVCDLRWKIVGCGQVRVPVMWIQVPNWILAGFEFQHMGSSTNWGKWFHHKGKTQRLSESDCVSVCTYYTSFPPHQYFTRFTTFHLCGNSFSEKPNGQGLVTDHWSMAKIQCSHCSYLTLASDWDPKPCFKPLQAETTHPRSECNAQHLLVCPSCNIHRIHWELIAR